jgi:hypothetical protein
MSMYSDDALAARFAALAPQVADGDWLDVQRRVRRCSRRRVLVLAAAVGLAAVVVGSAFAVGRSVVDFWSAPSAPATVDAGFEQSQRQLRYKWNADFPVLTGNTRTIIDTVFADGSPARVFVAPRRGGGFCYHGETRGSTGSGCVSPRTARREPLQPNATGGALESDPSQDRGWRYFAGYVTPSATERLEVRYEDHTTDAVPFSWVGSPIGAGFFAFDPGAGHERPGTRATEIVALDDGGRVLARYAFGYTVGGRWDWPRGKRWPDAIDPQTERTVVYHGPSGRVAVRVADAAWTKGYCWESAELGGGCSHPPTMLHGIGLERVGGRTYLYGDHGSARFVALRFQDGQHLVVKPLDGHVLVYEIPRSRFAPGRRLVRASFYDWFGHMVRRVAFDPKQNAYYTG